jgi:class 3 adenylate cyclase
MVCWRFSARWSPTRDRRATRCSRRWRYATNRHATLRGAGLPELRIGIVLHGGEVVAGVIGAPGLSKFSVTGDPITVASRIEGLTSQFEADLLIGEDVRRSLDGSFGVRPMPPVPIKGKP